MGQIKHIQVPNIHKPLVHYDTGRPLNRILRHYFYCQVCQKRSPAGWGSFEPCPFCGAMFSKKEKFIQRYWECTECHTKYYRPKPKCVCGAWGTVQPHDFKKDTIEPGTCHYGRTYTPEEEQYIMNKEGACHP